jgi:hypothetical protein
LVTNVMYIRYRDIQDDNTETAFLANFLVFLYAERVDDLLMERSLFRGTAFDMEVAVSQTAQTTVRSIQKEAERRITANPQYVQHNPSLYNRVLRLKRHANSCNAGYCFERLDELLNNQEVDFLW